jgi:hypothetical protein
MTSERDIERVLDLWLAERPVEVAERVLEDVADRITRQPQHPAWRVLRSDRDLNSYFKPLLAIAAIIAIAVAGFAVFRPSGDAVGPPVAASPSPDPTPSPTSSPSSVGVAGACDLMTTDEAADALGISSPVAAVRLLHPDMEAVAPSTFPSVFCGFSSEDRSPFVLRYEVGTGADAFAIWKNQPGVEAVSGLGDAAAWAPAKTMLYILKGDRLVTIMPIVAPDPTLTLEAAKAIGAIVATRM